MEQKKLYKRISSNSSRSIIHYFVDDKGLRQGECVSYNSSGEIIAKYKCVNGLIDGFYFNYLEGKISEVYEYDKGKRIKIFDDTDWKQYLINERIGK